MSSQIRFSVKKELEQKIDVRAKQMSVSTSDYMTYLILKDLEENPVTVSEQTEFDIYADGNEKPSNRSKSRRKKGGLDEVFEA